MNDQKTPALDYEAAKDVFFRKLEHDRFGRGRMESALFHTAAWIFEQGCHERDKLLAERDALKLQRDALLVEVSKIVCNPSEKNIQSARDAMRDVMFSEHYDA